jgi:tight adherence protein B
MLAAIAAILAFLAVAGLVAILTSDSPNRRLDARLSQLKDAPVKASIGNVLRRDSGTFPFLRGITSGDWARRARMDLDQAGVSLKVSEYLLLRLTSGVLLAVLLFLAFSSSAVGLLAALGGFAGGLILPALYIGFRRARRLDQINSQLPEALALISNSLRSGFAFTQAVELATKQLERPLLYEFNQFLRDTSLGSPTDEALLQMSARTGSYDLEMMVSTILIQRTTGGNLSEILDNVADTIRERERLQGEIKALTASQRLTGLILSIYPVALFLLLLAISPTIYKILLTDSLGRMFLLVAFVLQVIGMVIIRRILKLEV